MIYDLFDISTSVTTLLLAFGALIGVVFGTLAQISRFCLRRAVVDGRDLDARAPWVAALIAAMISYGIAANLGWVDLSEHRYLQARIPFAALIIGGVLFGIGMVLTRGCISRLSVLGASGNLRALSVLVVFAIVAQASQAGILSPLRTALAGVATTLPIASLSELPLMVIMVPTALGLYLLTLLKRGASLKLAALGAGIGLLVVVAWAGTSVLLIDPFEPTAVQGIAFTAPWSETLFWALASTAVTPGFGVGLIGGVLAGATLSAFVRGETQLVSFESPAQTSRYALGAVLMGFGAATAGGCTLGAGLSGAASLSISAIITLLSIIAGGYIATRRFSFAASSAQPAE